MRTTRRPDGHKSGGLPLSLPCSPLEPPQPDASSTGACSTVVSNCNCAAYILRTLSLLSDRRRCYGRARIANPIGAPNEPDIDHHLAPHGHAVRRLHDTAAE